jgi:hypothetical protein
MVEREAVRVKEVLDLKEMVSSKDGQIKDLIAEN